MLKLRIRATALAIGLTLASGAAPAADKVVFQLDWFPSGDKAPVYVGIQQGFFAAEGLEVTLQSGRGSSDAITKIATGNADFGNAGISALMTAAAQSNIGVKAVFSVFNKQPDALFTAKGGGIGTLKDVVGKTVAVASFSSSLANWPLILALNGVNEADVKLLKVEPGSLAPMLATGKTDATISWVTAAPGSRDMLQQAGKELQILPWWEFGLDGYGSCMFAAEKVLKERPDVARRFVRAFKKSVEFMVANPDAAANDIKKIVPELTVTLTAAEVRAAIPMIKNEITERDGLGAFNPVLLRKTWEWVAKGHKLPLDKLDPDMLADRSLLSGS
jgi:NitT/TauT family transport system substrate-binding protein